MKKFNNKFIVFEGPEGAGKTTIIYKLMKILEKNKIKVISTREPGGIKNAEKIRNVIFSLNDIDPTTELLLYLASRNEHKVRKIRKYLEEDYFVICDRYIDSSLVYQGMTKNVGIDKVKRLNEEIVGRYKPNLTFILDVDIETTKNRLSRRKKTNRFDNESDDFLTKIRNNYLELPKINKETNYVIIDATLPIRVVIKKVIKEIETNYGIKIS